MVTMVRATALTTVATGALLKGLDKHMLVFSVASVAMALDLAVWVPKFLVWANVRPAPWFRYVQIGAFFLAWIVNPLRIAAGFLHGFIWFTGEPTFTRNRERWHGMWARRRARRDGHMATHGATAGAVLAGGAGQLAQVPPQPAPAPVQRQPLPPPIQPGPTHDHERVLSLTPSGDIQFTGWGVDEQGIPR